MANTLKQENQIRSSDTDVVTQGTLNASPSTLFDDLENIRFQIQELAGSSSWKDDLAALSFSNHASRHESGGSDTVNHDNLTGFVANEHIDWTSASSNLSTSGNITGAIANFDTGGGGTHNFTGDFDVVRQADANDKYIEIDDTAGFDMALKRLTTPTASTDAATKGYVDSLTHDGFTDFVANEHIDWTSASSNFLTTGTVDGAAATFTTGSFTLSGGTTDFVVYGSGGTPSYIVINDSAQTLSLKNLATPSVATDAANKSYVDSQVISGGGGYKGIESLSNQDNVTVTLDTPMSDTDYSISALLSCQATEADVQIFAYTVYDKTTAGFKVKFSGTIPSSDSYQLEWYVSETTQ